MSWPAVTTRSCRHCGASSDIYCSCDPPAEKTHVAELPLYAVWEIDRRERAKRARHNGEQQEDHRRERRMRLRDLAARRSDSQPFAKSWGEVIGWMQSGYETLGDVEDIRMLAAFYAAADSWEMMHTLAIPYLMMGGGCDD